MTRDLTPKSDVQHYGVTAALVLFLLIILAGVSLAQDEPVTDPGADAAAEAAEPAMDASPDVQMPEPDTDLEDGELETADVSSEDVDEAQQEALAEEDPGPGTTDPSVCAACHGADGNSTVPQWPKIAGQHKQYLVRHQQLIQSGDRPVPEMMPIVEGMTDEDFEALADYFASQQLRPGVADEGLVATGEQLYRAGNPETNVPACMACHGPAGAGDPLAGYPRVSGQHALYTANMLRKYRDGTRWGEDDANSMIMVGVAEELTDEEIESVASYLEGLHSRESGGQVSAGQR